MAVCIVGPDIYKNIHVQRNSQKLARKYILKPWLQMVKLSHLKPTVRNTAQQIKKDKKNIITRGFNSLQQRVQKTQRYARILRRAG